MKSIISTVIDVSFRSRGLFKHTRVHTCEAIWGKVRVDLALASAERREEKKKTKYTNADCLRARSYGPRESCYTGISMLHRNARVVAPDAFLCPHFVLLWPITVKIYGTFRKMNETSRILLERENLVLSHIVNPNTKYKVINIRNKNWDKKNYNKY